MQFTTREKNETENNYLWCWSNRKEAYSILKEEYDVVFLSIRLNKSKKDAFGGTMCGF